MIIASTTAPRAFAVWWKELERWVIPSSLFLRRSLPAGWTRVRVGDLVSQVGTRVKVEAASEYKMTGVKWYGEGVFHRETVRGDEMSASQVTPLVPGALIYNRLFAWKASFAVVPPEFADCYVSSEFPQFVPDTTRILPEYLCLFCTRAATIRAVNAASTGSSAVSRNRFKEDQFVYFEVPLPPLVEQEFIVSCWRKAQDEIASARTQVKAIVGSLNERLWKCYRQASPVDVLAERCFQVSWQHIEQWDGKSARAVSYRLACPSFVPLSAFAAEATELVRPWEEPDKEWPVYGVDNSDGVFLNQNQKGSDFNAPYKRIKRDWFFHNPTRANVGSLGIVPEVPEDAITSPEYQVWRLTNDTPPGYVATLINTDFFLRLVDIHRVGAVKQRLYVENLLRIVVPAQAATYMRDIAEKRARALAAMELARRNASKADEQVETLILGSKALKDS